jgi:hypothetical protein
MTLLPACFMTSVCTTFICTAKIGFNIPEAFTAYIGLASFFVSMILFFIWYNKRRAIPSAE